MFVEPRTKSSCSDVILAVEVIAASQSHLLLMQESFKSYLPGKKTYLSWTNGWDFFQALLVTTSASSTAI